jgi:DNA-binding MarR family transcriptional regulator
VSEPRVDVLRHAPRKTAALLHIATHPGASNRAVAAGIGIRDEGQSSKLLTRMQDLGLVVNRTHDRGRPNAWHLTVAGRRLVRAFKESERSCMTSSVETVTRRR